MFLIAMGQGPAVHGARWRRGAGAALLLVGCAGCTGGGSTDAATTGAPREESREEQRLRLLAQDGPLVFEMMGRVYANRHGEPDVVRDDPDHYPMGSAAVPGAPDFHFAFVQGGPFDGDDLFEVGPTGWAEVVFRSRTGWRRTGFQLSEAELASLQRELVEIDVYGLKELYRNSQVEDGTSWSLRVQASGQRKQVGCDNAFPEPLVRLSYFVRTGILAAHAADLEQGEKLPFEGAIFARPRWSKVREQSEASERR